MDDKEKVKKNENEKMGRKSRTTGERERTWSSGSARSMEEYIKRKGEGSSEIELESDPFKRSKLMERSPTKENDQMRKLEEIERGIMGAVTGLGEKMESFRDEMMNWKEKLQEREEEWNREREELKKKVEELRKKWKQ